MQTRSLLLPVVLASSCFLHAASARAESFLLTATAPQTGTNIAVSASATLTGTADPTVAGAFDLTGGTGTFNGAPIALYTTGTIPAGSFNTVNFTAPPFTYNSTYEFDNVVYTSGNGGFPLDIYGLLFSVLDPASGQPVDHFNPFSAGGASAYDNDETVLGYDAPLYTLTLTDLGPTPASVTPEPTSIALLGTGLLGLGGILRRRHTA